MQNEIKKGSMIREHGYGVFIDSTVINEPVKNERGQLVFKSITKQGYVIDYMKNADSIQVLGED